MSEKWKRKRKRERLERWAKTMKYYQTGEAISDYVIMKWDRAVERAKERRYKVAPTMLHWKINLLWREIKTKMKTLFCRHEYEWCSVPGSFREYMICKKCFKIGGARQGGIYQRQW